MSGALTKKDIVLHSLLVIHEFGWRIWWRALVAYDKTFLQIISEAN